MDRRDFIKTGTALAGAAALGAQAFAAAKSQSAPAGRILPMNRGWRFLPSVPAGGHAAGFDETSMAKVIVPHTNKVLPWHNFDDKEYEFVSLYRRKFRVPASAAGKRVFIDFEGAMTATTVHVNGQRLGEYKGGYTPFSFEVTGQVKPGEENLLSLAVDATERADIPPFGNVIDYLTFGGLYREVALRIVPQSFVANIAVRPKSVLTAPALDVLCLTDKGKSAQKLEVRLEDGGKVLATATKAVAGAETTVSFHKLPKITLWDLDRPKLYTVRVRLIENGAVIDEDTRVFGFRHAEFTEHGFELNGKPVKLRGLNRHQTFPFVGQAMAKRAQRHDAWILKNELHINIVRTSHYPQSHHFLDACDELGLLVLEEIPGWQHIGDAAWKDIAVDNVERMVTRDWNHPSIALWGVRINESADDHDFYTRTNALAHLLDPTRQTGGIRTGGNYNSEFLEDVFTINDFGWPLKPPRHSRQLNTEFCGHMFPTKPIDNNERHTEHFIRHARMHDAMLSDPRYSGAIGWCAFDYNTHNNFGSGDRICYHGVMDIFRLPKPAAAFYRSQIAPEKEIVLEPAFHWAIGDSNEHFDTAMIASNCERLRLYLKRPEGWKQFAEVEPDRKQFPHLKYAPFTVDLKHTIDWDWGDLKIEGYIGGALKITRLLSGQGADREFVVAADDSELTADGADVTRVVLKVTDEFGNVRPFANDPIVLKLDGPADLIGDNPFALFGGVGAVWIRARETAGTVTLTATHPRLGTKTVLLKLTAAPPEMV
ncbi:glycoside hydrolase family 2 protein [Rhizomicrobium electricum]|uniref:Glycoside hydrolase family 2 TIM barrel-domain containing protein n=1 Tax=Rhizomicrobium electricum TaxID=480070 RepID=A0ABN1ENX5_9PROT|nr:glycoside hydrolase family 2 TIM barrel-domain containing protein [Rhizomicrobium electricum]NIJ46844.1 beta-galactosidase [Rhizomicrobium electricum]